MLFSFISILSQGITVSVVCASEIILGKVVVKLLKTLLGERCNCTTYMTGFEKTLHNYGTNVQFTQCVFLVPQVRNCRSPDYVIHVKEPFFCYRRLRRLVVKYTGEMSLHFDRPSLYSCCAQSLLLRVLIGISARGLSWTQLDSLNY